MSKKKKNKKRKAPASDGENAPPKLDSSKEDEPTDWRRSARGRIQKTPNSD